MGKFRKMSKEQMQVSVIELKRIIEHYFFSANRLSKFLGVSRSYISEVVRYRTLLSVNCVNKLKVFKEIDPNLLRPDVFKEENQDETL